MGKLYWSWLMPVPHKLTERVSMLIQPLMAESYDWTQCNIFYGLTRRGDECERKLNNSRGLEMDPGTCKGLLKFIALECWLNCCQKVQDFWQHSWLSLNLGHMYTGMQKKIDLLTNKTQINAAEKLNSTNHVSKQIMWISSWYVSRYVSHSVKNLLNILSFHSLADKHHRLKRSSLSSE